MQYVAIVTTFIRLSAVCVCSWTHTPPCVVVCVCLIACNDGHVGVCMYVSYVKLNIVMFSAEPKLIKHDV